MGSKLERKQRNNLQKNDENKAKIFKSDNIYWISVTLRKGNLKYNFKRVWSITKIKNKCAKPMKTKTFTWKTLKLENS